MRTRRRAASVGVLLALASASLCAHAGAQATPPAPPTTPPTPPPPPPSPPSPPAPPVPPAPEPQHTVAVTLGLLGVRSYNASFAEALASAIAAAAGAQRANVSAAAVSFAVLGSFELSPLQSSAWGEGPAAYLRVVLATQLLRPLASVRIATVALPAPDSTSGVLVPFRVAVPRVGTGNGFAGATTLAVRLAAPSAPLLTALSAALARGGLANVVVGASGTRPAAAALATLNVAVGTPLNLTGDTAAPATAAAAAVAASVRSGALAAMLTAAQGGNASVSVWLTRGGSAVVPGLIPAPPGPGVLAPPPSPPSPRATGPMPPRPPRPPPRPPRPPPTALALALADLLPSPPPASPRAPLLNAAGGLWHPYNRTVRSPPPSPAPV